MSLGAAFAGAVLVAMSGLAYAGALPGPAQGAASDVLSKVGVTLPTSHNDAAGDAGAPASTDESGSTGDTGGTTGDTGGTTGDTGDEGSGDAGSSKGKGKMISELAHNTPAPGKGKVIAPIASNGKSHVGNPPGQAKKSGDAGGSHKPDHPSHPTHPDHPSSGGGGGNSGGSGHSGS